MEEKRVSCRAIIFMEESIVSMYRENNNRHYYTFPGGGKEQGESEEECVKREVLEEFGLQIVPIKKVYTYESQRSIEHFFICNITGGKFGSGDGEEFQPNNSQGVYKPTTIELQSLASLPLMPPEIAHMLLEDYKENGKSLSDEVKYIFGEIK